MLFNKNENGQAELKELLGFLYAGDEFANIKTDIELAEETIIEYIGQPVYDRAQTYYDNPEPTSELNEKLVKHIQLPVAYYGYHAFAAHTDVSHSQDGRKVLIDPENEKMAWEWMIRRDDDAILNKAHKTTDRLIAFLEKNEDNIAEWKNSDAQKAARALFINTAQLFDSIFPIDNSRRFFIKILPFIREVERKHILPVLGRDRFEDIKAALQSGDFEDYEDLLSLIRVPLAYLTIGTALRRLSVTLLPNGIFQEYESERLTQKARQPVATDVRREIAQAIKADGMHELENLQKEISRLDAEAAGETFTPDDPDEHIDPDATIFRL